MDYEEAVRIIHLLMHRCWVQTIHPVPAGWLLVETTDGKRWDITSPLSYARLLYFYECQKQVE